MKSILVDTNLLLDDSEILFKLNNTYDKIVIPITVLKELDKHKFNKELAYSARQAILSIRLFKDTYPDKLSLVVNEDDISTNDLRIIRSAHETNSIVATKDISMSVIAESKDVETKLYGNIANGVYEPYLFITNPEEWKHILITSVIEGDPYFNLFDTFLIEKGFGADQWFFVFLISGTDKDIVYANNPKKHCLERIDNNNFYRNISTKNLSVTALDLYQVCAIYALYEADHVLITGKWGSGKSLLATAYAIVTNSKKTFITRPPVGIDGKYDIGFLPGDKNSKLEGWAMGFLSATYFLFGNTKGQEKEGKLFDYVKEDLFYRLFELIDINSLQGLSLLDDFLLVDEAQYCTIDLMSMLLSRATEDAKLIITGDLAQSYSIKPSNSGLLKLLRALPHHSLCYVDLKNTYRSDLLELADKLQDRSF
jgi:PhoH-like ATPase